MKEQLAMNLYLYHYVPKGSNVFQQGLLSFSKNSKADINYYIKRSGKTTKEGIVSWMEGCFEGRSRGIRFFTTPLEWHKKSLKIKELIDNCDSLQIDLNRLNKDGLVEAVYLKPSIFEKCNPPDIENYKDEYLIKLNSVEDIDFDYKQTFDKCDDDKGLRMAPLRFYVLVIKDGVIPPQYITKLKG